ncbi:transporter, partial [Staphylococcus nepalensis]
MFIFILLEVILPILLLILLGFLLQMKFSFELKHFSALITYCLMPASVFVNIYQIQIDIALLLNILYYIIIFSVVLILIGNVLSK